MASSPFEAEIAPVGLLDRFKVRGILPTWWNDAFDELKVISAMGFTELIDGWVATIRDFVTDETADKDDKEFKPLEHKIVARLVPAYLKELAEAEAKIETAKAEKEAFEPRRDEHLEDADEEYDGKEEQLRRLAGRAGRRPSRVRIAEAAGRIKWLRCCGPNIRDGESIAAMKKAGRDTGRPPGRSELAGLLREVEPVQREIAGLEDMLRPWEEIKERLRYSRAAYRRLEAALVDLLDEAPGPGWTPRGTATLVVGMVKDDIAGQLDKAVAGHRRAVVAVFENLFDKYSTPLEVIEPPSGIRRRGNSVRHSRGWAMPDDP